MTDSHTKTALSFLPGFSATFVSIAAGYPLDTIKTRMQTGMYKGVINCAVSTVKKEGVGTLYRGVASPFATLLLKRTLQFRLYEECKKTMNPWIAGVIASATMSPLSNPTHVIKIRMQNSTNSTYSNIVECIKDIAKKEGVKGFFRGVRINFIKDIMFGTLYLGTYGHLNNIMKNVQINTSGGTLMQYVVQNNRAIDFFSGGLAGSITWTVLMPIDMIKTTYQSNKSFTYILNTIKTDGIMNTMWRGTIPAVSRVFPTSALSMLTYGFVKEMIDQ